MALVVFLRGVNVGGHRTFRPSVLAGELSQYEVVNVGAAGTFVVRTPRSRAAFLAELHRRLPFEAEMAICDGRDLVRFQMKDPFGAERLRPDVTRFVGILTRTARIRPSLPLALPAGGKWLVRVIGSTNRFVYGVYRRDMKTIGYLGKIDKLFGVPAITRNWSTISTIMRLLQGEETPHR